VPRHGHMSTSIDRTPPVTSVFPGSR
jgi:hypothetical protein